jgi:hypothetical protein
MGAMNGSPFLAIPMVTVFIDLLLFTCSRGNIK